jgi:hypothetical protein
MSDGGRLAVRAHPSKAQAQRDEIKAALQLLRDCGVPAASKSSGTHIPPSDFTPTTDATPAVRAFTFAGQLVRLTSTSRSHIGLRFAADRLAQPDAADAKEVQQAGFDGLVDVVCLRADPIVRKYGSRTEPQCGQTGRSSQGLVRP